MYSSHHIARVLPFQGHLDASIKATPRKPDSTPQKSDRDLFVVQNSDSWYKAKTDKIIGGVKMASRQEIITQYITKEQKGLEIAPWHSPLVPRKEGYNSFSLDIYNTEQLKKVAREDEALTQQHVENIEHVDFIGSAIDLDKLVERSNQLHSFDYVISSHNFEHLPNPIKFLKGCERVLRPGGIISMAIPDRRTCFDYFRPHSTTAGFIEAFLDERERPTLAQMFEMSALTARFHIDGAIEASGAISLDPAKIKPMHTLEGSYATWLDRHKRKDQSYVDTHCWAFTPASFELILRDIRYLGLIDLDIVEVSKVNGNEFYAHLIVPNESHTISREQFYETREVLLHRIQDEAAENSKLVYSLRCALKPYVPYVERRIFGPMRMLRKRLTGQLRLS